MLTLPKHNKRSRIAGNASLELCIFFPFLIVFLLTLFTLGGVVISHTKVEAQSRYQAWKFRNLPWLAPTKQRLSVSVSEKELAILGQQAKFGPQKFVNTLAEDIPPHVLEMLAFDNSESHQWILGAVWDHREIRFASQRKHPRLTPMEQVYRFTDSNPDLREFRRLGIR